VTPSIFLYVILCSGSTCSATERYPMPDWRTCQLAASTFRYEAPKQTTENESAAGVFCGGPNQWRGTDGNWHRPEVK
jgi:hypothetical protein